MFLADNTNLLSNVTRKQGLARWDVTGTFRLQEALVNISQCVCHSPGCSQSDARLGSPLNMGYFYAKGEKKPKKFYLQLVNAEPFFKSAAKEKKSHFGLYLGLSNGWVINY